MIIHQGSSQIFLNYFNRTRAAQSKKMAATQNIYINVIGVDPILNNFTIEHLKNQIQHNGNTVCIMPDPCEGINLSELIRGKDLEKSIKKLCKIWDETKKYLDEDHSTDFVIFRQSLESLQSLSSILGSKAAASSNKDNFRVMRRLYRRENEAFETENKKKNTLRINLYIFDSYKDETLPEEATLNAVLNHACRTQTENRIFHFHSTGNRGGDIWSRICGLIQTEAEFSHLLYDWHFDAEIFDHARKNAQLKKRKHLLDHTNALERYAASTAAKRSHNE